MKIRQIYGTQLFILTCALFYLHTVYDPVIGARQINVTYRLEGD